MYAEYSYYGELEKKQLEALLLWCKPTHIYKYIYLNFNRVIHYIQRLTN